MLWDVMGVRVLHEGIKGRCPMNKRPILGLWQVNIYIYIERERKQGQVSARQRMEQVNLKAASVVYLST